MGIKLRVSGNESTKDLRNNDKLPFKGNHMVLGSALEQVRRKLPLKMSATIDNVREKSDDTLKSVRLDGDHKMFAPLNEIGSGSGKSLYRNQLGYFSETISPKKLGAGAKER